MPSPVIGIDLGTTYSCVAYLKDGEVIVIPNERGNRITPSCVAYTDRQRLVGDVAMDQIGYNPSNTVYSAKRLIGRKYHDRTVQDDRKLLPFTVVNVNERPSIEVNYRNKTIRVTPEEVSAAVLGEMKRIAEKYLGTSVTDAVVTVPAYFSDSQRKATQDAGKIAGLNVLRIINEPTAAAIAFNSSRTFEMDNQPQTLLSRAMQMISPAGAASVTAKETVLVFDFGGGTLDVSILETEGHNIAVKSTSGDNHLGGEDLTNCLVGYLAEGFKRKYTDITSNNRALRRLYAGCERAKITLSDASETRIDLDLLDGKNDLFERISSPKFTSLCQQIYNSILAPVKDALDGAGLSKSQIDRVLMVGGSTRVPRVREILSDFFDGKALCFEINPDEAVARGAAILAAKCGGADEFGIAELSVHDVTPFSLGVNVNGGLFSVVIPRNTPIPAGLSRIYSTIHDDQTCIKFTIYEGERDISVENNRLGSFLLNGLPPLPRHHASASVSLDLDVNGILTVTATDKSNTTNTQSLTVTNNNSHLSKYQVEAMIKDARKYKQDDDREVKRVKAMLRLEDSIYTLRKVLEKNTRKIAPDTHMKVLQSADKIDLWLKSGFHYASEYIKKQELLEKDARCVSRFWSAPRLAGYL